MRRKPNPLRIHRCLFIVIALSGAFFCRQRVIAQDAVSVSEVEVTAAIEGSRQEAPVGPYHQPDWTTQRGFSTNRVYVRPPGSIEFNQLWTPEFKDGESLHKFREEIEIGLPYRFQLDLYQNWEINEAGRSSYSGSSVELRYALADWGRLPLNPTLYGEWTFNDGAPDAWEVKLLFGETLGPRWSWAANLTYEHEIGGGRAIEMALSSALSYAVVDQVLNVGAEILAERKTEAGSRGDPEYEVLLGPSLNVRPTRHSFVTVAPLFGVTDDSPDVAVFVVAGFNFQFGGPQNEKEEGPRAPASMFGR